MYIFICFPKMKHHIVMMLGTNIYRAPSEVVIIIIPIIGERKLGEVQLPLGYRKYWKY